MNLVLEKLGRRDGENAGPRADVENGARAAPTGDEIEHQEAAARRPVMAGAEGERRIDLDRYVIGPDLVAAMRSMHDEAARPHGLQALKR